MADREELLRRQRALADFGELALRSEDLQEILDEGCRLVGEALGTDLAKIEELEHERDTALVRAGVGWAPGIVGEVHLPLSESTSGGPDQETVMYMQEQDAELDFEMV